MRLSARLLAEAIGTAFLLAVVVGSGIMAERLAGGNIALALLANALATGAGLFALIMTLAGVSGAHFNPAVSLSMRLRGELSTADALGYMAAQVVGALAGVAIAHGMFDLPAFTASQHVREGVSQVAASSLPPSAWCWSSWARLGMDCWRSPYRSPVTSWPRTGSPLRLRLPIQRSRLPGRLPIPSPGSSPAACRGSCWRSCLER